MSWSWFDLAFPWIGLAAAVVLVALLFGTQLLRGEPTPSRWHDRTWLSWMAMVAYLIHNAEEYGLDALGRWHSFPDQFSINAGLPTYPASPIPPAYWLSVNITLFWVAAPLAALLSKRHPIVGLALYSVVFINGLFHLMPFVMGTGYNPGLLTAVAVFLPLSAWVGYACFGRDRLSYKVMALLIFDGVLLHVILVGSTFMFINGVIGGATLVLVQIINAGLLLLIAWFAEKWRGGVLARPVHA
jgi:Protein of unknown function with HXXEE motif